MLRNQISEEEIIAFNREDDEQHPSFDEEDHYPEHEYTKYHRISKSNESEAQPNMDNFVEENGEVCSLLCVSRLSRILFGLLKSSFASSPP